MYKANEIKLRQDGSIDTGYYMKLVRQRRSEAARSTTVKFLKALTSHLKAMARPKSDFAGRMTHFDSVAIECLTPANDADEQVANAYKFRGVI